MSKEFIQLIAELKTMMTNRSKYLESRDGFNAYTQGEINNVNERIEALEHSAKDIVQNYPNIPEMRINFRKRANEIKKEIKNLG